MKKLTQIVLWLVVISLVPMASIKAQANDSKVTSTIKFEAKPYGVIQPSVRKVEIVHGESEEQKKQKEAEAKRTATVKVAENSVTYENLDLGQLRELYRQAAARYGIDWKLIEAVHQVESGKSSSTCKSSSAGATGPMQFLPSTFRHYGSGDICNLNDSIFAAANLLANAGANEGRIDDALLAYNHSWSYVQKVKSVMNSI